MLKASCTTVAVLGVPFQNVTMDESVALIEEQIREGGFHQVATANVDFLRHAMNDPDLRHILGSCELVVPDGMPVVWMSRLLGSPLKERIPGIDLVERLADLCNRRGYGIFFLGASESSSRLAAKALARKFPGLRIVGRYSPPPQPLEKMDHEEILRRIHEARPDILLVAFGNPKQEQWIARHRDRLRVPVCIGVGGTLDALSGNLRRAPQWMQSSGLEWLYRAAQEPRRLTARYLADAVYLLQHLPGCVAEAIAQPRNPKNLGLVARQVGNTRLIAMNGDLCGASLEEFNSLSGDAALAGMNIVLDMSKTGYVGPEFIGSLMRLGAHMRRHREQLWLAALPARLARLLRTGRLHKYFMTTTMVSDALYRTAKAEQKLLASFIPAWDLPPQERAPFDVRLELLQGVCQRIVTAKEVEVSAFAPANFASAGG